MLIRTQRCKRIDKSLLTLFDSTRSGGVGSLVALVRAFSVERNWSGHFLILRHSETLAGFLLKTPVSELKIGQSIIISLGERVVMSLLGQLRWAARPSFRVLHHSLQYGHGKENDHFWSRPEDHGPDVRVFGRRGYCHLPLAHHLPCSRRPV